MSTRRTGTGRRKRAQGRVTTNYVARLRGFVGLIVFAVFLIPSAHAKERNIDAYAPPLAWGQWTNAANALGSLTFEITYETLGGTVVVGQVRYFDENGKQVVKDFRKSVKVTTG